MLEYMLFYYSTDLAHLKKLATREEGQQTCNDSFSFNAALEKG